MLIWKHYQWSHAGVFYIVDPWSQELHSRKLIKTLVYEINAQCSHRAMQTWWRGPSMHNVVTDAWKHGGEGPLDVFACQETSGVDGSSIQPTVVDLCPVESHLKMWFCDTWWLLFMEWKTKWRNIIACHFLLQECMGKPDMGTLQTVARRSCFVELNIIVCGFRFRFCKPYGVNIRMYHPSVVD